MFQNKTKPKKPEVRQQVYEFTFDYEDPSPSLEAILEHVKKHNGVTSTARISNCDENRGYDGSAPSWDVKISFMEAEDSPSHKARLLKYEEVLAMYEFWYSRNKEVADAAEVAEAESKRIKETKELEGRIRAQEWKVTRAQQELKVLQEQMNKRLI